jgi:hypothetical protein
MAGGFAMTDFNPREPAKEPGLQPDPMLQTGRRSSGWVWLFGIAVLAVVVVTLYGLNNREPQTASNESAPAAQSSSETTGAAPPPADQQNGKSDANASQSGNSKQASPANSPNAAPPQKDQSGQTNQKPQQQ